MGNPRKSDTSYRRRTYRVSRPCENQQGYLYRLTIWRTPNQERLLNTARVPGRLCTLWDLPLNGGVHSSLEHPYALCDIAKRYELKKVYLHCFMDGRDTDPPQRTRLHKPGAGALRQERRRDSIDSWSFLRYVPRPPL